MVGSVWGVVVGSGRGKCLRFVGEETGSKIILKIHLYPINNCQS